MKIESKAIRPRSGSQSSFGSASFGKAVWLLIVLHMPLAALAQLPSGTWQYSWGDDFSGTTLDQTKWSYNYPWGTTHNHDAVMSPNNVQFGDGTLTLVAQRNSSGANFTSGAISSGYTRTTFNGGYIEARILLPDTPGSWPAFWGLYSGWPPEMDIMEYPIDTAAGSGYAQDEYHTAFHYTNPGGSPAAGAGKANPGSAGDLGGSYHTFGVNWVEDTSVTFYFDGAQVSSFTSSEVAEMVYMYLILNYAVGGWPGTPNTTEWPVGHIDRTKVDWVRVWKQAAATHSDWAYSGVSEYAQWDTVANWSNGVPNLGGVTSSFGTVTPAAQRIDWSGRRTLSVINLDGNTRYRFGWPDDRLVLGYGNNGSLGPTLNIAATTTTEHEIYAQLEWSGTLNINNHSAHPLLLTSEVMGGDGININGPGIVSFDGNNTYSGNTIIDSGPQGPGVARVRGQNALGIGGTVIIGEGGNSTTGRLELENNSLVSNNVNLNGRNNSSVGILNNSGNNTISGQVGLTSGGANYRIQSDAGSLTIGTGGATGITIPVSGSRNVTLRGVGSGNVVGNIVNGGGTLSVTKADAGTWTLSGANTYTGPTTVNAGTLLVNGVVGPGAVTVSGGVLGGTGTITGPVNVQNGAVLAPGASAGRLTVSNNVTLASGGATLMEISKSPFANDQLRVTGTLNYGGTLTVTNVAGTLALGDSFQLFDTAARSGSFATTNLPPLGPGLGWNFDPANGVLSVVQTVSTNPTNITYSVSNGLLTLSWPAGHTGWRLQAQTNPLTTGLWTNWHDVPDSTQTNAVVVPVSSEPQAVFFRMVFP